MQKHIHIVVLVCWSHKDLIMTSDLSSVPSFQCAHPQALARAGVHSPAEPLLTFSPSNVNPSACHMTKLFMQAWPVSAVNSCSAGDKHEPAWCQRGLGCSWLARSGCRTILNVSKPSPFRILPSVHRNRHLLPNRRR